MCVAEDEPTFMDIGSALIMTTSSAKILCSYLEYASTRRLPKPDTLAFFSLVFPIGVELYLLAMSLQMSLIDIMTKYLSFYKPAQNRRAIYKKINVKEILFVQCT